MHSNSDSKFKALFQGAGTPFRALLFMIQNPELLWLSLLPMFFSLFFYALFLYFLIQGLILKIQALMTGWLAHFSGIALFFAALSVSLAFIFLALHSFMFMTSLCASPFNDILAEKTEKKLSVTPIKNSFFYLISVFFLDLRKTGINLILSVFFSLGMLIPGVGIIFFLGLALLNTFTFITYPQSRRKHGILESISWMRENFFLCLGFGLSTLLLFSVPLINLFALPVSVIGGTMLFLRSR